jgi:hypothetical protein
MIENLTGKPHLKIVSTSQGYIHKYEYLKRENMNCNDNIYFKQKCLRKNLIPSHAMLKNTKCFPSIQIYTIGYKIVYILLMIMHF